MRLSIFILSFLFIAACESNSSSELSIAPLFQDHMVIQHDLPLKIWGSGTPGEEVEIVSSWGEEIQTVIDQAGTWTVEINAAEAGGPYTLSISSGRNKIDIEDVLSGEVWLASGQSNMQMPLAGWPPNDTIDYSAQEIAAADFPEIRMFNTVRTIASSEKNYVEGEWLVCTPELASDYSATAYFFSRKLYQRLNVPIGIIHSSWGGTPAEAWVSKEGLKSIGDFNEAISRMEKSEEDKSAVETWIASLKVSDISREDMTSVDLGDEALKELAQEDAHWGVATLPAFWEAGELGNFDGVVWYRKSFEFTPDENQTYTLSLGAIDDMDIAYVNGEEIGRTMEAGMWQEPRQYEVPGSVLVSGRNTIAVKVFDGGGGGGIYTGPIALGDLSLEGEWKYLPVAEYASNQLIHYGNDGAGYASRPEGYGAFDQNSPAVLYSGMIHPVIPYSFKGAIWYQGESNVGRAEQYSRLFPGLIQDWRRISGRELPFYFVQIAPFAYGGGDQGNVSAALRDAQRTTLDLPGTGMVVTMDIGNNYNIHPGNKKDVGERLAANALATTYGRDVMYSGPLPEDVQSNTNTLSISFAHAEEGLIIHEGALFEVAGEDGVFHEATAATEGHVLTLVSSEVESPVHARYAWKDVTEAYFFNTEGWPASSFHVQVEEIR